MAANRRCSLCSRKCSRKYIITIALAYVIFTFVLVHVYTNIHTHQLSEKHYVSASTAAHNNSLIEAIGARASYDRCIILAMTDKAFVDMAINLYETGLKPHGIENYLFIGVGNTTCHVLHRHSVACFSYCDEPSADQVSTWGHADFKRKMTIRPKMILEALAANFTVVHTDVDVSFFDNPLDEIRVTFLIPKVEYLLHKSAQQCHYGV